MKFIHLTDTHLVLPGQKLYGLDPLARLEGAIADIKTFHRDAVQIVVTGDLAHWGEEEAYQAFCRVMDEAGLPYVAMVGNHDRRANCLQHVPAAPRDMNGFVQGVSDHSAGRFVFLDTLDESSHAGALCGKRRDWLAGALAATPQNRPFYIFMHHPPFKVGIEEMDLISLQDAQAFAEVIAPYRSRLRHLFFGHVHRPISGSWQGIPFSTLRGTNHQVWFDMREGVPHLASHEPAAYAVVLLGEESTVVHTHDYLDQSPRFLFSRPDQDERAYQLGPLLPVSETVE